MWIVPLPWLANFFGWIVTEMGRQPFMVYGLLTVEQGVSANSVGEVLAGLIGLWVVYLGLIGLDIYLLSVTARAGIHHAPSRPDRRGTRAGLRRRRGVPGTPSTTPGEGPDDGPRRRCGSG